MSTGHSFETTHWRALHAIDEHTVLCTGSRQEGPPAKRSEYAHITRWHDGQTQCVYESRGQIVALHGDGPSIWAVLTFSAEESSAPIYALLYSRNGGLLWAVGHDIPVDHVTQLLVVSQDELWVQGKDTLAYTADQGRTWYEVQPPAGQLPEPSTLSLREGAPTLAGSGLRTTRDQAGTWEAQLTTVPILNCERGAVIGMVFGECRYGILQPRGVTWRAKLPRLEAPVSMMRRAAHIRIVAAPHESTLADGDEGWIVLESHDTAGTWHMDRIAGPTHEPTAILTPGGRGFAINNEGVLVTF